MFVAYKPEEYKLNMWNTSGQSEAGPSLEKYIFFFPSDTTYC